MTLGGTKFKILECSLGHSAEVISMGEFFIQGWSWKSKAVED